MLKPQLTEPDFSIAGGPSIKQYHVLNDKRHILVRRAAACQNSPASEIVFFEFSYLEMLDIDTDTDNIHTYIMFSEQAIGVQR
jgi:hypothetical protein